jgi:hypothetical protein
VTVEKPEHTSKASFKLDLLEALNADRRVSFAIGNKAKRRLSPVEAAHSKNKSSKSALAVMLARLTQIEWPSRVSVMSQGEIAALTNLCISAISEADAMLVDHGYLVAVKNNYNETPRFKIQNPRPDDVKDSVREARDYQKQKAADRQRDFRERRKHALFLNNVTPLSKGT